MGQGKPYTITVIPGDGIGPEVTAAMRRCVDATNVDIVWDEQIGGATAYERCGNPLPNELLASIERNKVAIKGPTHVAEGANYRSINVELRKRFKLYANVRPVKFYPGVSTRITNPEKIDLVVIRENVEDLYTGIEFKTGDANTRKLLAFLREQGYTLPETSAIAIKGISPEGCENIVRYAFEYAQRHGRKKITAVSKYNIMPDTDGLFKQVAERVACEYPAIALENMIIDNAAQQSVLRPEQFDVIVTLNLYGDILSDLEAGLVGGIGVAAGANIGKDIAVFEAVHGTWPAAAGMDKANPAALTLSAAMMLHHLGEYEAGRTLEKAVNSVIHNGTQVTGDLNHKHPVGTRAMADAIIEDIALQQHPY